MSVRRRLIVAVAGAAALVVLLQWPAYAGTWWIKHATHHMMERKYNWDGPRQYRCILNLWQRESSWNKYASNPYSGAYGIPQALPGSKMASAGQHWASSAYVQAKWGLGYVHGRWHGPCRAWTHDQNYGWY